MAGPDLGGRLRAEGLDSGEWGNGPGDRYGAHRHGYDKVIVVSAGSIRFGLPGPGLSLDLAAGDRLELPAGTEHDALVGLSGVSCLEAHLPAGRIPAARGSRRESGDRAAGRHGVVRGQARSVYSEQQIEHLRARRAGSRGHAAPGRIGKLGFIPAHVRPEDESWG